MTRLDSKTLGSFDSLIFQLKINSTLPTEPVSAKVAGTYFHEHVHFWQSISTTYGISSRFESFDWIASAVRQMGGHDGLILHGLSKPVRGGIRNHLIDHYKIDGVYRSREFNLPIGESDAGFFSLNDKMACYEYVRWNASDQTYCATPLGAHAIYENLAFVKESIIVRTGKQFGIQVKSDAPCESPMHHYTVFTELFWNCFHKKAANGDSLIATMLAVLDACLQIPHSPHAGHAEYIPMTNPGLRFVELFPLLHVVGFVDGKGRNFKALIDKLFEMKQWPSPSVVLEEHYRWLHPILQTHRRRASAARRRDSAKYDDYIARRVKQVAANVHAMFGRTVPAHEINRQLTE